MKFCQLFIHGRDSIPSFPGAGLAKGWERLLVGEVSYIGHIWRAYWGRYT